MLIDDPVLNCLLAVCCEPAEQRAALARELVTAGAADDAGAAKVAAWMLQHFDLAPAGSLASYRGTVARLARGPRGR